MHHLRETWATLVLWALAAVPAPAAPAGDTTDARALYAQHCASCHGQDLQGGTARSMVDGMWEYGGSRAQLARSIRDGIPAVGMPGYGKALNENQIEGLVTFLRAREGQAGLERPKFPEQLDTADYTIDVDLFARGLKIPWAIAFIDAKRALVTERAGQVRVIENGRLLDAPVRGTPAVRHFGQGGLMDVAVDPEYAKEPWIYLAYSHASEADDERAMTRIVRGRIRDHEWVDEQVLWQADPAHYLTGGVHFGCRIAFDRQGSLYFSHGERGRKEHAQDLTRPNGKVHRIHRDGTVPQDNPFYDHPGAVKSIFTYGNRNVQGLAIHPITDRIFATEHGPRGGDELNWIRPGLNYGWPVVTYGINYDGSKITDLREKEGMEQPLKQWTPSIAVCGLDFVRGDRFKKWEHRLLVGALAFQEVRLVTLDGAKVVADDVLLKQAGRVRDVRCGPDGAIYVVLNAPDIILRLTPRGPSHDKARRHDPGDPGS